jgi:hypothetical protein
MDTSSAPHGGLEPQDYFGNSVPTASEQSQDKTSPISVSLEADPDFFNSTGIVDKVWARPSKPDPSHSTFANQCVLRAQSAGDVDPFHSLPSPSYQHEVGFFDWTRIAITPAVPSHIQFARSVDWASTPLGPIEYWASDLRQMCNLIMESHHYPSRISLN